MAALDRGDVALWLVGEDRLEAMAVVVGEGELGAGMGTLAPTTSPLSWSSSTSGSPGRRSRSATARPGAAGW
ncbi:MAG: hypothetical protein GEU90_17665 [Gemmatimonas sp.]|nr:hypothetical protein [Gemmatimonas sp.]